MTLAVVTSSVPSHVPTLEEFGDGIRVWIDWFDSITPAGRSVAPGDVLMLHGKHFGAEQLLPIALDLLRDFACRARGAEHSFEHASQAISVWAEAWEKKVGEAAIDDLYARLAGHADDDLED